MRGVEEREEGRAGRSAIRAYASLTGPRKSHHACPFSETPPHLCDDVKQLRRLLTHAALNLARPAQTKGHQPSSTAPAPSAAAIAPSGLQLHGETAGRRGLVGVVLQSCLAVRAPHLLITAGGEGEGRKVKAHGWNRASASSLSFLADSLASVLPLIPVLPPPFPVQGFCLFPVLPCSQLRPSRVTGAWGHGPGWCGALGVQLEIDADCGAKGGAGNGVERCGMVAAR